MIYMTFDYYEKHFRDKAIQSGFSEDNVLKCLNYAKPLIDNKLPVIFNTANLAALVGYKKNYIKKSVLYPTYFYRSFKVKKRNGGIRIISEPLPSLKEIQYWILENILNEIPVSKYAKAYVRNRTLVDNIKYHKNKEILLGLDIEDFFTSIKRSSVEIIFRRLGYSSNISNLLSKLCCCYESLPQGAPTSPYLSNIFLRDFDEEVSKYCNSNGIKFTRYADDITLSGSFDPEKAIIFIKAALYTQDLKLNKEKIKIMRKNERQIVTGVIVNEKLQIPKIKRDKIRQEVYFLKKFGLSQHLINTNNTKDNYVKHLMGKINFALHINPNDKDMIENLKFVKSIYSKKSIEI